MSNHRVQIVALEDAYRDTSVWVAPYFDEVNHVFIVGKERYTAVQPKNPTKEFNYQTLSDGEGQCPVMLTDGYSRQIKHGDSFDPDDPRQWLVIQMAFDNNVLAPNKASVNMGTHLFYLRDDQYEARQTATKADKVFEALGLVREMTPRDKMAFAFFSNQPARTMSEELIDAFVKDLAMRNPDQIIRSMSAGDWKTRAFIHRAIHYGLMTADGGVHKVGADVIGIDEDSAVHFVMDQANRELMNQLQQRMKDEQAREAGLHA